MTEGTILVVEDDYEISEIIKLYLEKSNFQVVVASDGEQALQLFAQKKPDLILLDILLPDINGISLCIEFRKQSNVPIIYLSCKQEAEDIIAALQAGGDDYITKPFNPTILAAQVKDKLRRMSTSSLLPKERHILQGNQIEVNLLSYEVHVKGQLVPLQEKEVRLLIYFMQHPNRICSVEELHQQIWGIDSSSSEATVVVHISNLRKKIEQDISDPKHIITIRGFGYKYNN